MFIANIQQECIYKHKAWKAGMESKGLRVNMKRTKPMVSGDGHDLLKKSWKSVLSAVVVCRSNSIPCSQCMLLVHKKCSHSTKRLIAKENCVCPRCKGESRPIDGRTVTEVNVDHVWCGRHFLPLRWYDVFRWGLWPCHCCQMLCGLGKVQRTLACPNHENLSPRIRSKVYEAYVRSMVAKRGDQITANRSGSVAMTVLWTVGSVASKTETKYPQLLYDTYLAIKDITSALRCRWQIYHKLSDSRH